jgi:hypothetical protein
LFVGSEKMRQYNMDLEGVYKNIAKYDIELIKLYDYLNMEQRRKYWVNGKKNIMITM